MPTPKDTKPWPVAEACFVEVETAHPREHQLHLIFENRIRLAISDHSRLTLATELIHQLRKIERRTAHQKGGRS